MNKVVKKGDVVIATAGRDKGKYFLVISVNDSIALITDGRTRKVLHPKKKNVKHLKSVYDSNYEQLSERILSGDAVGNARVFRVVRAEKQIKQED